MEKKEKEHPAYGKQLKGKDHPNFGKVAKNSKKIIAEIKNKKIKFKSIKEASSFFSVSRSTIRNYLKEGKKLKGYFIKNY